MSPQPQPNLPDRDRQLRIAARLLDEAPNSGDRRTEHAKTYRAFAHIYLAAVLSGQSVPPPPAGPPTHED